VSQSTSRGFGTAHELISDLLIALVVLHVLGVLSHWVLARENLVASMLHGRKRLPPDLARAERPLASGRLAAVLGALALAVALGLTWMTLIPR
jgi:hypothetical protein